MSSLLWKVNRLRTMAPVEVLWRVEQAIDKHAFRLGIGLARVPAMLRDVSFGNPFLSPDATELLAQDALIEKAEQLLAGRWNVFALHGVELGFPPQWNRDPLTGTHAPGGIGKAIDFRRKELVGNIKYLWEPSRHLDVVTLAQAWRVTGKERYAEGARTLLSSWIDQCPYPMGVHWSSSLELAVRLVNWACAWHLLEGSSVFKDEEGAAFRRKWLACVYQHCHFIQGYLSLHSSANNHLIGEYMGLFVGSVMWPCWDECAGWQRMAHQGLEREAIKQNTQDGVNREQAIYYQHEVMAMMLLCHLVGRANDVKFSDGYLTRLERMAEFVIGIMDASGNVPMIGDADDAQMIRLDHGDGHGVYHSLLASCAVLFKRSDFKRVSGVFDDANRWMFGSTGLAAWNAIAHSGPDQRRTTFSEGGYYIFGSYFDTAAEIKGVIDCGPIGYPSIAAHGHADSLSMLLSVCGEPCLIDPGTYSYWADQPWRDYFRGTSAHNTVRVDEIDQSVSGGRFMWTRKAVSRVLRNPTSPEQFCFEGMHDGYLRLSDPVEHRRMVEFDAESSCITVTDKINSRNSHVMEQFWHFAPNIQVQCAGSGATICGERFSMTVDFSGPNLVVDLHRGSENPIFGWFSDAYEKKQPCSTLRVRAQAQGGTIRASFQIFTTTT